jgi:hypothetical protein
VFVDVDHGATRSDNGADGRGIAPSERHDIIRGLRRGRGRRYRLKAGRRPGCDDGGKRGYRGQLNTYRLRFRVTGSPSFVMVSTQ